MKYLEIIKVIGKKNYESYPDITTANNGIWIAYKCHQRGKDYICLRNYNGTPWRCEVRVADMDTVHKPSICTDKSGRIFVSWAGYINSRWHVYLKYFSEKGWSNIIKVSNVESDYYPVITSDEAEKIWIIYVGFKHGKRNIFARSFKRDNLSREIQISRTDQAFRPTVTQDRSGNLWIAWDEFKNKRYDIYVKRQINSGWSDIKNVTRDINGSHYAPRLSFNEKKKEMWLVWSYEDEIGDRWFDRPIPTRLMARYNRGDSWVSPKRINDMEEEGIVATGDGFSWVTNFVEDPALIADEKGRMWFFWATRVKMSWNYCIFGRYYNKGKWSHFVQITDGRVHNSRLQIARKGNDIYLLWESVGEFKIKMAKVNTEIINVGYSELSSPGLKKGFSIVSEKYIPQTKRRNFDVVHAGKRYKIFWGDLHGHARFSYDGVGTIDQWYNYARHKYNLDFSAVTEHGKDGYISNSEWRILQNEVVRFHQPGRFITISGYEFIDRRKLDGAPDHRNVYYLTDDQPIFIPQERGSKTVAELHRKLHDKNSLVIAHCIGGGMDLKIHNPKLEPVVEISSGHARYEYFNNPTPYNVQGCPYDKEGFWHLKPATCFQDLLKSGLKVGAIASTDCHTLKPGCQGLVACYLRELTREEIFKALKARRCYATTGKKICLDFKINGHFMGEEFKGKPPFKITIWANGETKIEKIQVVRNNKIIYTHYGNNVEEKLTYVDKSISFKKVMFYYIRVTQIDGEMAWSSPIWVSL